MRLNLDRLLKALASGKLDRNYFVFGEEPLQRMEAVDAIRAQARASGHDERIQHDLDLGADWQAVLADSQSLSLFSSRRLIELRLGATKPDKAGSEILTQLLGREGDDDVLLIVGHHYDGSAQKTRWFKALEQGATTVQARNLGGTDFNRWLAARAKKSGLRLSRDATDLVATRAEGNMLAAAQELEKLALLNEPGEIDVEQVFASVHDQARYDVFSLVDTAVAGNTAKAVRMLRGLRAEGFEGVVVCWSLNRELRVLARVASAVARGVPIGRACADERVWSSRTELVSRAAARLGLDAALKCLLDSGRVDRAMKGQLGSEDPWELLEALVIDVAGRAGSGRSARPSLR